MKSIQPLSILLASQSAKEVASLLGLSRAEMAELLQTVPSMYMVIPLKKKDGTPRSIRAPKEVLKKAQRTLLDRVLINAPLPSCAYGFSAGKGIVENARLHAASAYVLNVDIKDFFPSVHYTRVGRLYKQLGASDEVAKQLTSLVTYEHCLPQGAPSSPYIATLVLNDLDRRLTLLCSRNRLSYSRYFDDITISGGPVVERIIEKVIQIIASCGFEAHTRPDKLRLYRPGEKRLITGIEVMGGTLQVPSVDKLDSYLDQLLVDGLEALEEDNPSKARASLKGKIVFVAQVDKARSRSLEAKFNQISWPD